MTGISFLLFFRFFLVFPSHDSRFFPLPSNPVFLSELCIRGINITLDKAIFAWRPLYLIPSTLYIFQNVFFSQDLWSGNGNDDRTALSPTSKDFMIMIFTIHIFRGMLVLDMLNNSSLRFVFIAHTALLLESYEQNKVNRRQMLFYDGAFRF